MNTPQIEPVTDEDAKLARMTFGDYPLSTSTQECMRGVLDQDRRRVAERQAGRQGDYNPASLSHEAANAELAHISGTISDAREIERLRAEVAAHRKHDVLRCDALMKAEAEVAALKAACAAKDAALRVLDAENNSVLDRVVIAAARALDAGRNWIDATGAVETCVFWYSGRYVVEMPESMALSRVLIVPVKQ